MTDILIINRQQANPLNNRMIVTVEKGDIEWGETPPVDTMVKKAAKPDDEGKSNAHIRYLKALRITPRSLEVEFLLTDDRDWSWNQFTLKDKWGSPHLTTNCFVVGTPKKSDGTPEDPPADCKQIAPS
jgi:hypothetical protein